MVFKNQAVSIYNSERIDTGREPKIRCRDVRTLGDELLRVPRHNNQVGWWLHRWWCLSFVFFALNCPQNKYFLCLLSYVEPVGTLTTSYVEREALGQKRRVSHTSCSRSYLSVCNWRVEYVVAWGSSSTSSPAEVSVGQDGRIVGSARTRCDITSKIRWVGTTDCAAAAASAAERSCATASATIRWPSCILVGRKVVRLARIYQWNNIHANYEQLVINWTPYT